jgi:hypothetical protein
MAGAATAAAQQGMSDCLLHLGGAGGEAAMV